MRGRSKLSGALAAVAALAATTTFTAPTARADDPARVGSGLEVTSHSLYVVDSDAHAVHVTIDTSLTNVAPGTATTYTYFDSFGLPVLAEAANLAASAGDRSLRVSVQPTPLPFLSIALVDLQPNLLYRQTQDIRLTYDLPALAPRSTGLTRNNDAFVTFPVFPVADPGQADVEIDVPHRFAVETVGADLAKATDGTIDKYTATAIADPLHFDVFIAASDETKLHDVPVAVADTDFTVRAWPDDQAWADFVSSTITKSVPALVTAIGLDVPVDAVALYETVTPYLYGYAGWYNRQKHRVDIGDDLEAIVVVHELSHMWFNEQLIDSRWVDEGLAQEFAAQAVHASGGDALDPTTPDTSSPAAIRLATWSDPDLTSDVSLEQEAYGYDASYAVIHTIAAEIGPAKMRDVLAAASSHTVAYRGEHDPEKSETHDWKYFLDLVDEVGGATGADQVVRDLVLPPESGVLLDQRAEARATYKAFVAESDAWPAPLVVRSAMGRWNFATLDGLLARARKVRAVGDDVATTLQPLGIEPSALKAEYESGTSFDTLDADAEKARIAAQDLVKADKAVHGGHNPLATVGLIGGPAKSQLAAAKRAFADGSYDDASAHAHKAESTVDGATTRGLAEVGLVIVVGAGGTGGFVALRRRRRRRQDPPADLPAPPDGLPPPDVPFLPAPPVPVIEPSVDDR